MRLNRLLLSILFVFALLSIYVVRNSDRLVGLISLSNSELTWTVDYTNSDIEVLPEKIVRPTSLLFVGDIMLDRGVAQHAKKYGVESLFSKVEPIFQGKDAVIGNLEGTITSYKSVTEENYKLMRFTFDPSYAGFLKKYHFSAVSLANNHSGDFGPLGYQQTLDNLRAAGIAYFGSSRNSENLSTQMSVNGKNVCLVGYHQLFVPDPSTVISEIKKIQPVCSLVVLFAHWGEEYQATPTVSQRDLAHKFVDAGADLVIGAHPHVVQPIEIYKNKAIFYSLGNFVFDQNLSFFTEHGLTVNVEFDDSKTVFTLVPTALQKAEVEIAEPEDRQKILQRTIDSTLSEEIRNAILTKGSFVLWNSSTSQN